MISQWLLLSLILTIPDIIVVQGISEGTQATIGQFPYAALILDYVNLLAPGRCGGTIIDEYHILTAGHCSFDIVESQLLVYAGFVNLDNKGTGHEVRKIHRHPDTKKTVSMGLSSNRVLTKKVSHDIAILTLRNPLCLGGNIRAAQIPTVPVSFNTAARIFGWGFINTQLNQFPSTMSWTEVQVADNAVQTAAKSFVDDAQFLAIKGPPYKYTALHGDSGSGLIQNGKVIGIVSRIEDAYTSRPVIYTDVYKYKTFIENVRRADRKYKCARQSDISVSIVCQI